MARTTAAGLIALAALLGSACDAAEPEPPAAPVARRAPAAPTSVPVEIGDARLHLELAADPSRRYRGLSGRDHVPEGSGMLFAFPVEEPRAFVMRDCLIPIDIAFLDARGRVVALHTMPVEPPRAPGESARDYEGRLPLWPSGAPAQFAIEAAAGTWDALGLRVGDAVRFDRAAVLERTH